MPITAQSPNASNLDPETEAELTEYGITRETAEYFRLGEFRYSNLKDAVAQARRQRQTD